MSIFTAVRVAGSQPVVVELFNPSSNGSRNPCPLFLRNENRTSDELFIEISLQPTTTSTSLFGNFDQCLENGDKYCWLLIQSWMMTNFTHHHHHHLHNYRGDFRQTNQTEQISFSTIAVGVCLGKTDCRNKNSTAVRFCQTQGNSVDVGLSLELIIFLVVVALLVFLGTLVELLPKSIFVTIRCFDILVRFLRCFDLMDNFRRLFSIKSRKSETEPEMVNLDILNGLRIVAIFWVILAHCSGFTHVPLLMQISPFVSFPTSLVRMSEQYWLVSAYLSNTYYAVTIFFMARFVDRSAIAFIPRYFLSLTSGILCGYKPVTYDRCNLFVHAFQHTAKRWLRIAPLYLVAIFLTYQLRYLGSGPLFHQELIQPFVEPCLNRFWHHFFFVQNYLDIDQRCGSHTWYLAADFQLHLVAFILVHLCRCRGAQFPAFIMASAFIMLAYTVPVIASLCNWAQLPDFQNMLNPRQSDRSPWDLILFYYGTHMHADSFFFGWTLGYLLSQKRLAVYWPMLAEKKIIWHAILAFSLGACLMVPILVRVLFVLESLSNFQRMALFLLFSLGFKLGLLAAIFVGAIRCRSLFSRIMSAPITRPFARLVFGVYLSHQAYIWFLIHQQRTPLHVNFVSMATFIVTILGLSIITAVVMNVTIEEPARRIKLLLFPPPAGDRPRGARQTIELSSVLDSH